MNYNMSNCIAPAMPKPFKVTKCIKILPKKACERWFFDEKTCISSPSAWCWIHISQQQIWWILRSDCAFEGFSEIKSKEKMQKRWNENTLCPRFQHVEICISMFRLSVFQVILQWFQGIGRFGLLWLPAFLGEKEVWKRVKRLPNSPDCCASIL